MNTEVCPSNSQIYQFYSNRTLLQYPKSTNTIVSDINEELEIDYKSSISAYILMQNQYEYIMTNFSDILEEINKTDSQFYILIKNTLQNNIIDDYKKLNNENKYRAIKNLYRISDSNFIYTFIEMHKNILPKKFIKKVLPLIINITYSKNSNKLNQYIKKTLLMKILASNIKSENNISLIQYYNYCRFIYLYNIIKSQNLIPITYNDNNGALYFSISYVNYNKKEQILERLHQINFNNSLINIDEVKLYINTQYGEISNIRRLFDKRCKKFHTHTIISDNLSYNIPNIVRQIIHELMNKFILKKYKHSYKKLLGKIILNNKITENYCEKINNDGTLFRVPINGNWETMSNSEIRRLLIKNIDIKLLLDTYKDIIDPILKIVVSIKNKL